MLVALLVEFADELSARKGKLDSDPHLWMPMTLQKQDYIQLMGQKEVSADVAGMHHDRIKQFLVKFREVNGTGAKKGELGLFGAVTVGQGVYWWDYGTLKLYQRNALLMSEK
jgi:hypothetical protein